MRFTVMGQQLPTEKVVNRFWHIPSSFPDKEQCRNDFFFISDRNQGLLVHHSFLFESKWKSFTNNGILHVSTFQSLPYLNLQRTTWETVNKIPQEALKEAAICCLNRVFSHQLVILNKISEFCPHLISILPSSLLIEDCIQMAQIWMPRWLQW